MFKRKISLGLVASMTFYACMAQTGLISSAADSSLDTYVIMAETQEELTEVVEEVVGAGLNQDDTVVEEGMEESGITVLDLSKVEVNELEDEGVIVEKNVDIDAFMAEEDTGDEQTDTVLHTPEIEWNLYAADSQDYVKNRAVRPIKIAVLDSGINYHPDIAVEEWVNIVNGDDLSIAGNILCDASGHGTAIASLINSVSSDESIQGMNEDAVLYSVQVLDEGDKGLLSDVVKGIYWAIDNDMDIINMSFGMGKDSEILHQAVRDAYDAGILMVAAAGNSGGTNVAYPAAYEEVVSVGATTMEGTVSESSTTGNKVDIYAPGEHILANAPLMGTQVVSGTSMACAEVAAAASVIWEREPQLTADEIRDKLIKSSAWGVDNVRMLDVDNAVSYDLTNADDKYSDNEDSCLAVFDEAEVSALWHYDGHRGMVPSSDEARGYRLMYAACTFPDDSNMNTPAGLVNANPMQRCRFFHGAKTYPDTIKYLVDLAHAYYKNDGTQKRIKDYQKKYKTKIYTEESNGYTVYNVVEGYLANYKCFPKVDEKGVSEESPYSKAYKLMGVAIHTIGDTFAHRTIVNQSALHSFNEADFMKGKYSQLKSEVKSNKKVEFRKLNYRKDDNGGDDGYLKEGIDYEDNKDIFGCRYTSAKDIIEKLVCNNGRYDFRTNGWKDACFVYDPQIELVNYIK